MLKLLTDSESYIFQIYVWVERDCSYIFNIIFGCEKKMIHFSNYIEEILILERATSFEMKDFYLTDLFLFFCFLKRDSSITD